MSRLAVTDLRYAYDDHEVLKGVSFEARPGELLAVLGPNGVGKSTLFRCMLGLLPHYKGRIEVDEKSIKEYSSAALARKIAYVPQSHYPSFNYSVFDMVLMGTTAVTHQLSSPGPEENTLADRAIDQLGITHLRNRGYKQVSGGERQLVLIARALAQQARLLIMDEPTANLDFGNQLRVLSQVRQLARDGYTVIQSTHSPDHAFQFADRVLAIKDGVVEACGPPDEVLTSELVGDLYGIRVQVIRNEVGTRTCVPVFGELSRHLDQPGPQNTGKPY